MCIEGVGYDPHGKKVYLKLRIKVRPAIRESIERQLKEYLSREALAIFWRDLDCVVFVVRSDAGNLSENSLTIQQYLERAKEIYNSNYA